MHHQVHFGQAPVDFLHHVHGQDFAIGLAAELVGSMRGAHGNGKRIDTAAGHEIDRLFGVGQQLLEAKTALETVAILFLALARLQRAQATEFTFHRNADVVRDSSDLAGDIEVVLVACRRRRICLQRSIHHHRGEPRLHRRYAGRAVIAVILVQADGYRREHFLGCLDHLAQHDVTRVTARAATGLQDDRGIDLARGIHDRQHLFHVVDIESGYAVTMFGGVVE